MHGWVLGPGNIVAVFLRLPGGVAASSAGAGCLSEEDQTALARHEQSLYAFPADPHPAHACSRRQGVSLHG